MSNTRSMSGGRLRAACAWASSGGPARRLLGGLPAFPVDNIGRTVTGRIVLRPAVLPLAGGELAEVRSRHVDHLVSRHA
jgi:hypothetical protein